MPRHLGFKYNDVRKDPVAWEEIWREACTKEAMQFLVDGRTEWAIPKPGEKVLPGFWKLDRWYGDNGAVIKTKARWCIMGNLLNAKDKDFESSFSGTASHERVRLLCALSAASEKSLFTIDSKGAYLSVQRGENEKRLFMQPPKGFEHPTDSRMRLLLKVAAYGLPDSGRRWHLKIAKAMTELGFTMVDSDPCVYVRDTLRGDGHPNLESRDYVAMTLHVDDGLTLASKPSLDKFVKELREKGIPVEEVKVATKYVGTHIKVGGEHPRNKTVTLYQTQYINDLFADSGAVENPRIRTPLPTGYAVDRRDMPKEVDPERVAWFRRVFGQVLFVAVSTRVDIAYCASELGRVMSNPSEEHCNMLKRVCQYLKNTSHLGLRYGGATVRRNRNTRNKISVQLMHDHVPMGMADASFGCDPADRRSMTGWVILLNGAPIAYRAKRQPFAVNSTCESEILSLSSIVREVEATTRALADLGVLGTAPAPVLVFEDNQCALQVANGHTSLSRTKAIDLRRAVARQAVQRELIRVEYLDTKKMLADILTKQPPADAFEAARAALGILPVDDDEAGASGEI